MMYLPDFFGADYRAAERIADTLFNGWNYDDCQEQLPKAKLFRGAEIDVLIDAFRNDGEWSEMQREHNSRRFWDTAQVLVSADALNESQLGRIRRFLTADKKDC